LTLMLGEGAHGATAGLRNREPWNLGFLLSPGADYLEERDENAPLFRDTKERMNESRDARKFARAE
jgi:hypothetical protein